MPLVRNVLLDNSQGSCMKISSRFLRSVGTGLAGATVLLIGGTAAAQGLPTAVVDTDYYFNGAPDPAKATLGKNLFWDKLLSGQNDVSCGTCHNPQTGTSDALSLGLGAGAIGTAQMRSAHAAKNRIVRNALSLYNLGAKEFVNFNNDGDLETNTDGTFKTPAGTLPNPSLVTDLDNISAAQVLFPLMAAREQAGLDSANPLSACALNGDFTCTWNLYLDKIRAVPGYLPLFQAAYPTITSTADIKINHVANAIAAYELVAFRSDDSPFDAYLRGDTSAMSPKAVNGMNLFYGAANCSSCHSGKFQTDHKFWAVAMPQIGPGRRDGTNGADDGRIRNTLKQADRHKYKTPSLRNVALTGPWSHAGAYTSLEAVVRHHLDPVNSLNNYDTTQALLPPVPLNSTVVTMNFKEHSNVTKRTTRGSSNQATPVALSDTQVGEIMAFLHALTGESALNTAGLIPHTVPSGIPVADGAPWPATTAATATTAKKSTR
jgi:cytochrome c peroxidase